MPEAPRHETRKPLFTRRHYEVLAAAFREAKYDTAGMLGEEVKHAGIMLAQAEVMNRLADDNERFDPDHFYAKALAQGD